jgi:tetratricopeptide (TPR) repeat protein
VLVTLLVYLPVRHYAFVNYDDPDYVTENSIVQAGLAWAGVKWAFTTMDASNWHPLTWLSLMLDCQLFGLNAGWYHLVNVFFHAANAVLLFLLLLHLTGACWRSAFLAALFAWHPLHVESVAWVAERKDVLSAFFGLLTLLAYVGYVQRWSRVENQEPRAGTAVSAPDSRLSTFDYFLALFFFTCGLMAKPMLVTLPFVFLLLDYWPLQRVPNFELRFSPWLRLVLEKWPFFVLAVASCVVTLVAQERGVASLEAYPLSFRIGNAAVAYVKYLFQSVYPVDLAVIYPLPKEIPWGQVAGALVILAVISWLVWRARRQRPYLLVGWLWYLGMLVPVVGLVQVGLQAMADRYTYLPLIGVFLGVSFGMRDLAIRLRLKPTILFLAAALVLGGCLFLTAWQLRFWRDSETLYERALAVTTDNPIAQDNLGIALNEAGRPQAAIEHFREALRLEPDSAMIHDNLGAALLQAGHPQAAIEHFREALRLKPGNNALAHNDWGYALLQTGHPQAAMAHFREALRLKPDFAKAHNNWGAALLQTGHPQAAMAHFREALRLNSKYPEAYYDLGLALLQNGQAEEAITQFRTALQLQPNDALAHNNLGVALARTGHLPEAIQHYQEALRLQPNFPEAHCDLGSALLQNGQVEEAISQFRTALQLRPDFAAARDYLGDALFRWGQILFQKGWLNQAIVALQEGLQIHPDNVGARNGLGFIFLKQGQAGEAVAEFQKVLARQPDNTEAQNNLAWLLATAPNASLRSGVKAIELAQRANQLSGGQDATILGTLAAAYAEAGRFPEAVRTAQKALQLAASKTNATLMVDRLQAQIKFYQADSPFRDSSLTNIQATTP